jgi:hypothetical protein
MFARQYLAFITDPTLVRIGGHATQRKYVLTVLSEGRHRKFNVILPG